MIYKSRNILRNTYIHIILLFSIVSGENWFYQYGNSKENVFQSIAEIPDTGYVLLGYSNTLGNGLNDLWVVRLDQNLDFLWQRYFGGPENEFGNHIIVHQNSFIIVGEKNEKENKDVWILKLNSDGEKLWSRTYGGSYDDIAHSIELIEDHGFFITGIKTTAEKKQQGWVMLLNPDGEIIWENNFGGAGNDGFLHGIRSMDDGFIALGYTNSFNKTGLKAPKLSLFKRIKRIFSTPKPSQEIWALRLNKNGKKVWDKTYGGVNTEIGKFIYENADSSLFIMGNTNSFENKNGDIWVIQTEKNGYEIWNKRFGGKGEEDLKSILIINYKKILLSMNSNSSDTFLKTTNKNYYTRQILINNKGSQLWETKFSNNIQNEINSIILNRNNKILNVGYMSLDKEKDYKRISSDWIGFSDKSINPEIKKGWIFETDFKGIKKEETFYNGDLFESGVRSIIDKDLNIMILGNINAFNKNQDDIILLRYDSLGNLKNSQTYIESKSQYGKAFYNKKNGGTVLIGEKRSFGIDLWAKSSDTNGNIIWANEYGSIGNDVGSDVIESKFGTIIVGKTNSFGNGGNDGWLIGINQLGEEKWSKTYGSTGFDEFLSINVIEDDNYIVTGSKSLGVNGDDIWLMNIDENGNDLWAKTYGGNLNEKGLKTIICQNEDLITLGEYQNNMDGKGEDIIVLRTNKFGEQKWSKVITKDGNQKAYSICEVQNGAGYVIIGESQTDLLGIKSILLIRINSLGNLVWEKTFGESYYSRGVSVIDDGTGLIIMGDIDLDENGNSDIFLLKTDYTGMIIKY